MTNKKGVKFLISKCSLSSLYGNPVGRFLLTEEVPNFWTCFRDPYKTSEQIVIRAAELLDSYKDKLEQEYVSSIPEAKLYKGLLLHGYMISPKFLTSMDSFKVREDDVFLVSYPRSGTTWTEEILSCIYSNNEKEYLSRGLHERVVHLEVGVPFRQTNFLESLESPRLLATHLPFQYCPEDLRKLKCKIIHVVRNPKDQLVSYYHFHETAKFLGGKRRPWNKFFESYLKGYLVYGSWFEHTKEWWKQAQSNPDKILVISYEELQTDLTKMIQIIGNFLGKPMTEATASQIKSHCSFSNMKTNKAVNRTSLPVKDLFDNSRSTFIRKGRIGDWYNHFSEGQSEIFDDFYSKQMDSTGLRLTFTQEESESLMKSKGRIITQVASV